MRMVDIIIKKRMKKELSKEEIAEKWAVSEKYSPKLNEDSKEKLYNQD